MFLYLKKLSISRVGTIAYWKEKEVEWLELARMAYFIAILAISLKCERIFSFYAKQIIPKSSRLIRTLL